MASIRLGRYETEEYGLPPVCAKCGAKAAVAPPKRFRWAPSWLPVLIILGGIGLILFLILSAVLTKRRTVPLPLCEEHRNYWRNRAVFMYGGLVATILVAILAVTAGVMLDDKGVTEDAALFGGLGAAGLFLVWLISAAIVQAVGIRPNEITDNAISLTGLSQDFVEAVREDRRGEEDEDDDRSRRRRRDEDDEEERPRPRRREAADDGGYSDRDKQAPRRKSPPPDAIEEGDDRR